MTLPCCGLVPLQIFGCPMVLTKWVEEMAMIGAAGTGNVDHGVAHKLYSAAVEHRDRGEWEKALPLIEKALAIRRSPRYLDCYAAVLSGLGRQEEASRTLEEASRAVEGVLEALKSLSLLEKTELTYSSSSSKEFPNLSALLSEPLRRADLRELLDSFEKGKLKIEKIEEKNSVSDRAMLSSPPRQRWR